MALVAATPALADAIEIPTGRANAPLFQADTLITTGFSGTHVRKPFSPDGSAVDAVKPLLREFIDPDGAVVTLLSIAQFDAGPAGQEIKRRAYDKIIARDVGQVFGIALDDQTPPNLYLSATSAFGLNINGADRNEDMLPDRLRKGAGDAVWAEAQFGPTPASGPGSVYKVDGRTGQVSLLANIELDGVPNSAAGLGNIAFDAAHKVLFISDLDTGVIHRLSLDGEELETFDHGMNGRPNEQLEPSLHDAENRADITSGDFDPDLPDTWGFADEKRRVWGLAVRGGRLFYAVATGKTEQPDIWSIGLHEKTGVFLEDARWEVSLPERFEPFDISDLDFTASGSLVVAQRATPLAPFDYNEMTQMGQVAVTRFVLEDPDDPKSALTPSDWVEEPIDYSIGFQGTHTNANGGVALGPNYTVRGSLEPRDCKGTLWATGDALRDEPTLESALELGGALTVHGAQAQPVMMDARENTPPWVSYFHDFDGVYDETVRSGHMGDVEVLGCVGTRASAAPADPQLAKVDPPLPKDPKLCTSPLCVTLVCLANPALCAPQQNACMSVEHALSCDPETGDYVLQVQAADRLAAPVLDELKLLPASPPLGALPLQTGMNAPTSVSLSGMSAGQIGHVNICAFNGVDQASGAPYDCCNQTVSFKIPNALCEKEAE
ncbi:hypothetical protein [Planktotalea sp.]|uniref:hypothetical protein n=1 Tax=Planktotalea sp. TaxID=2029877 RepID=UPI00329926B6